MGIADQKTIDDRYKVYPRTLCFVTRAERVLLLRGAPDKPIWPNLYNGVGGHVEANEDVRTAVLREVQEETGLEVHDLRLRGVINIPTASHSTGILLFVFTAAAATQDVRPSAEGTLEWAARDRVTEYKLIEDLPILLPRVLTMKEDDAPFFALYRYNADDQLEITYAK